MIREFILKRNLITVVASLLVLTFAILVVIVLYNMRPAPEERELTQAAMLVDSIPAEIASGPFTIQAQGTVQPVTQTSVAAEVSGVLIEISERFVAGGFFPGR